MKVETSQYINQLVEHLFRYESGRMSAVLTRILGVGNMALVEDVVQDSLLSAIKHWSYSGIPDNPSAWLMQTAKNNALNIISHKQVQNRYQNHALSLLQSEWTAEPAFVHFFSDAQIEDDQLRMMFVCCHPSISADSQVVLILRTLCGFSIPEIASAFITGDDNINKRLVRARKKLREEKISFEIPAPSDINRRLDAVLECIYLLFNEGYNASSGKELIRYELCEEAIRLTGIISIHNSISDKKNVFALLSLMQLNASRFRARQAEDGSIVTLEKQDRSLWSHSLIDAGLASLENSFLEGGNSLYHFLAGISAEHCIAPTYAETNWIRILSLYDGLQQIQNTPVVALNRAIAVSKVHGPQIAITEIDKVKNNPSISSYYYLHAVMGDLYFSCGDYQSAATAFKKAIELAPLKTEKELLRKKLLAFEEK